MKYFKNNETPDKIHPDECRDRRCRSGYHHHCLSFQFQKEMQRQMALDQENRLKTFRELLRQKGSDVRIVDGQLMAGNYVINNNFELPDKLKELTGGTATIFMGDERVSYCHLVARPRFWLLFHRICQFFAG